MAGRDDAAGFADYVSARQAALIRTVPHWARLSGDPDAYVRRVVVSADPPESAIPDLALGEDEPSGTLVP